MFKPYLLLVKSVLRQRRFLTKICSSRYCQICWRTNESLGINCFICGFVLPLRLIAKYCPTVPVVSVVIPKIKTTQLKWSFSAAFEVSYLCNFHRTLLYITNILCRAYSFFPWNKWPHARQSLIVRGLFPMLADPRHPVIKQLWSYMLLQ